MPALGPPSARSSDGAGALVPVSSVDDLHDADLDLFLADRLAESALELQAVVARIGRSL